MMTAEPVRRLWIYSLVAVLLLAMAAMAPHESINLLTDPVGVSALVAIGAGFAVRKSMALTPWALVSGAVVLYGLALSHTPVAAVSGFMQLPPIAIAVTVAVFQLRVRIVGGAAALRPPRSRWGSVLVASTAAVVVIALGFPQVPLVRYFTGEDETASAAPAILRSSYFDAIEVGRIEDPSLSEVSGMVASRVHPGIFWAHNDSGHPAHVYCLKASGAACGVWEVTGAANEDWEDIAVGPGPLAGTSYLYAADIGDNIGSRGEITIYRVPEPVVDASTVSSSVRSPVVTGPTEVLEFRYPDGAHDAEALMIHPRTGDLYVITKESNAGVYRAEAPFDGNGARLERVASLSIFATLSGITGADISPDGRRVILSSYGGAYELTTGSAGFDPIWGQKPARVDVGRSGQLEAISYRADGLAVLMVSEGAASSIFLARRMSGVSR